MTSRTIHQPVSSFDSNGRYVGLANLVQMLRSTPDTPELESPLYDVYESSFSAPSDQQTPAVTTPAVDLRAIFNEVMAQVGSTVLSRGPVRTISY